MSLDRLAFDAGCLVAVPCFVAWRLFTAVLDAVRDVRRGVTPAWRRR